MINTFRLTHHILFYVALGYMFRSSLTINRPVCESCFTNAGYILGSHYVYNYASVYTCYINTLKSPPQVRRKKSHRSIQTDHSPPSYKSTRTPKTPEETQSDVLKSLPNIHVPFLYHSLFHPPTLMYLYNRYTHWHSCKHSGIPIKHDSQTGLMMVNEDRNM